METYIVPQYNAATGAGTISGIAREKGITIQQLLDANPQYKTNPNSVRAGASLNIPIANPLPTPTPTPTPEAQNANPGGTPVTPPTPTPITKTPEQIAAENTAKEAAKSAGLGGVALDDFSKYFANAGLSADEITKIKSNLGLTDAETKAFAPPTKPTEQVYNDAYASAGLADVKTKINTLLTEINTRKEQLNARLSTINENPWLSEASRSKSVQREKDFFDRTITNLTDQVNALNTVYTQGVTEVNNVVTRNSNDFNATQALNQAKLTFLQKKAESAIATEQGARVAKYLPEYLKGKAAAVKPDTIGSAETGYSKWNPVTGKFEQVIPGVGAKKTTTEQKQQDIKDMAAVLKTWAGADGFISPQQYAIQKKHWVEAGSGTAKDFDEAFSVYRNPVNENYTLTQ